MKKIHRKMAMALTLGLALPALLMPSISSGFPTDTNTYLIEAVRVGNFDFDDPNGPANNPEHRDWRTAPATTVPLEYKVFASANAVAPFDDWSQVRPGLVRNLYVKAIHDGGELLLRVTWQDKTFDENAHEVPRFFDALALMIPYPESDYPGCIPGPDNEPMIHMGMRCDGRDETGLTADDSNAGVIRCCPVSIHFWRPDKVEIENIVTNGPGTTLETAETDEPGVFHAWQRWQDNRWMVIMGRVLDAPPPPELPADTALTHVGAGGNLVDLAVGGTYPTVFANWDGSRDERNGSKFIGLWGALTIKP